MIRQPIIGLAVVVAVLATSATAEDGFRTIFNGKNLDGWVAEGWRGYGEKQQEHTIWFVEDGLLVCKGHSWGFLRYDKKLADFTLRLDYRMSPGCNSGVALRGGIFQGWNWKLAPSWVGYEMQILDDAGRPPTKHSSGSLYRYFAPKVNATRGAGEWNQVEITCRGPRIQITLNGQLIQDVDQTRHPTTREKPLSGYVSVQDHGHRIEFRNIRLKEL